MPDIGEALENPAEEAAETPEQEQAEQDPLQGREDLQRLLFELAEECYGYDKIARRQEVMDTRQQRFYLRDVQYIWWNEGKGMFFAAPQAGAPFQYGATSVDMPRYTDVYNVYTPCVEVLISAFTQNPPGVRFQAEDPKDGADQAAKSHAEKYRHYFDRVNDNKKLQQEIARYYCTETRTATVTEFDEKLGHSTSRAFGTLETKCPILARSIQECPYFFVAFERELCDAKTDNPDKAEKIKVGPTKLGSEYERLARIGALQGAKTLFQAGEAQHLVTEHWLWFRPSSFAKYSNQKRESKDGKDPGQTIQQELTALFPNGCKVKFIGDVYCGSKQDDMDKRIDISHPTPGDGMNRASMMHRAVPLQDTINDSLNLWKETYDYTIPVTWMACTINDIQAIREQMSEPGNHLPFKKPPNEPLAEQFYREPEATVSEDFIQYLELLTGQLLQFITGAVASLFGGSMEDQKTFRGYALAKEQAMGRMGLPWGSMQRHFAGIYQKAAEDEAAHREGEELNIEVPGERGKTQVDSLSFGAIHGGKICCYPDIDSSFPETFSAKRQSFFQFAQILGPAALQFINTPNNLEVTREMVGLEDLEIPGQEGGDKQRRELTRLMQEHPVPDEEGYAKALVVHQAAAGLAQGSGQPFAEPEPTPEGFMKSSVPVTKYNLHQFHLQEMQRFLESLDGDELMARDPLAYKNCELHADEHEAAMKQMALTAPPSPAPPTAQPHQPAAHPAQGGAAA